MKLKIGKTEQKSRKVNTFVQKYDLNTNITQYIPEIILTNKLKKVNNNLKLKFKQNVKTIFC